MMSVESNSGDLVLRIQDLMRRTRPDSPEIHTALLRIGAMVAGQAKINIRQKRLIDTGRLLNSLRYEFYKEGDIQGVKVGSFGVPYAAVHEFGYAGVVQVREHSRKGAKVSGHSRRVNIRARPYLRPAFTKHTDRIINILREALKP